MEIKSGRTIGERREHMETESERTAAHKKNEKRRKLRLFATIFLFIAAAAGGVWAIIFFTTGGQKAEEYPEVIVVPYAPTVEVIDEDASSSGITSRMKEYIGQAEVDFRELGYAPVKVVIPAGSIREVDFYLEGYDGYIKLYIDRGTGVSVEDTDRMLRYLDSIDEEDDFKYIDVRIDGRAYWK